MSELVFVYGTLKEGFHNHYVMKEAGGRLMIRNASVRGFTMYNVHDWYPAAHFTGIMFHIIYGEVYAVEDMAPLDLLEGFPRHYNRRQTNVNGNQVWIYYYEEEPELERIDSGRW